MYNRRSIYYWKCDRPQAFYALSEGGHKKDSAVREDSISSLLLKHFGSTAFSFRPAGGQGNHITFLVFFDKKKYFLRIEDGQEVDNYMGIEVRVIEEVRAAGVNTPKIYAVDSSRKFVPFSYQIMEFLDYPDLNSIEKQGRLDLLHVGLQIGECVARWQNIKFSGFGPFDPVCTEKNSQLQGLHRRYQDYYLLNWDRHLEFLKENKFLSSKESMKLRNVVTENLSLLQLEQGCMVHKDLALWNILGSKNEIRAFIDWDDAISGDPTDDLSLLACFHNYDFIKAVMEGYQRAQALVDDFENRFWMHLLRNMVVKAVIRVGAGYFERKDDFFLIGSGSDGKSLKTFTHERIEIAYSGLTGKARITDL